MTNSIFKNSPLDPDFFAELSARAVGRALSVPPIRPIQISVPSPLDILEKQNRHVLGIIEQAEQARAAFWENATEGQAEAR